MYLFIVNPYAGKGKALTVWQELEPILQQQKVVYEVKFTEKQAHATHIARFATTQKWTAIVAIGGDGTVHEVANGLFNSTIPMGYLPAGTGNDFARAWQVPFDPLEAWERIAKHEIKQTDVLITQNQVMLCYLSTGFDGYVARLVNQAKWKKWLGRMSYFLGAILALKQFRPFTLQLFVDGKEHQFENVWLTILSNCNSIGGGMLITPQANPTDGYLDLGIVHQLTKREFLHMLPKVYTGKHVGHPSITFLRGKQITLYTDPAMWAFADGEEIEQRELQVRIEPKGMMIL